MGVASLMVPLLPVACAEWLDWQPHLAWQQPWRWWTAAWVHLTAKHLWANLAGCLVLGLWAQAARAPNRWVMAWMMAWPLTHLGLLLEPRLTHYAGLSGVLHAGVAVVAGGLVLQARGLRQAVGAAVVLGLGMKVALERPWVWPMPDSASWDFPVATLAHATGAVAGLLAVAWVSRRRSQVRFLSGSDRGEGQ